MVQAGNGFAAVTGNDLQPVEYILHIWVWEVLSEKEIKRSLKHASTITG
jgi:hypothetical protein